VQPIDADVKGAFGICMDDDTLMHCSSKPFESPRRTIGVTTTLNLPSLSSSYALRSF
jgi:hypothetical protein